MVPRPDLRLHALGVLVALIRDASDVRGADFPVLGTTVSDAPTLSFAAVSRRTRHFCFAGTCCRAEHGAGASGQGFVVKI